MLCTLYLIMTGNYGQMKYALYLKDNFKMASNEGKVIANEKDADIKCAICKEIYTDARVLPCNHTFCLKCLEEMAATSGKRPVVTVPCPICRKEFRVPEEGFKTMPKNLFVAHVIEMPEVSKLPEEDAVDQGLPILCDVCKSMNAETGDETPPAKRRCVDCRENFCTDCERRHKVMKMTRDHMIVELGGKINEEELRGMLAPKSCDQHTSKILDYYCADCKKVVCISCFGGEHCSHKCSDVRNVSDEFRNEIRKNVEKILECMFLNSDRMETLKKKRGEFLVRIVDSETAILQRSEELKSMIDEHTKLLLDELTLIKIKTLEVLENEKEEIEKHVYILKSCKLNCSELIATGSSGDICQSVDDIRKTINGLYAENETFCKRLIHDFSSIFKQVDWSNFLYMNNNTVGTIRAAELKKALIVVGKHRKSKDQNCKISLDNPCVVSLLDPLPTDFQIDNSDGSSWFAAVFHNNILFVSGVGSEKNEIWGYDLNHNWIKRGFLIQGRSSHCALISYGKLYICGGIFHFQDIGPIDVLDTVETFDTSTNICTAAKQLIRGVYSAASVAHDSSIYIFGGCDKDQKQVDYIQVYNTIANDCTLLKKPMPRPKASMRAAVWEKSIMLLGGDTCFIFNTETETWQEREELKTNIPNFEMVLENDTLFIVSRENSDTLRSVPVSDIINNKGPPKWQNHGKPLDFPKINVFGGMMLPI